MNLHEAVPFCQRNIRVWVILLVVSSVLVLGFSIWLAYEGPGRRAGAPGGAGAAQASPADTGSGGGPLGAITEAIPLAYTSPVAPRGGAALNQGPQVVALRDGASATLQLQSSFNRAADVIRPCVVNINAFRPSAPRTVAGIPPQSPRFVDPFDGVPDKVWGKVALESVGSGVIVDPAGYVVTNEHLVSGATTILVSRYQHAAENIPARVVALDQGNDLALLRLQSAGTFPAVDLGDSSLLEVGDWVLAVGNPFGLGHTVTAGIVSGRRSSLVIAGATYTNLIQTDAPINQGSSGGPLVDLSGQVVGINTAIYAPTGVFNGTGFAIPSNRVGRFLARTLGGQGTMAALARPPVPALLASAPWLGLKAVDVDPALAAKLALPRTGGVFVSSVVPGSPAEEAEVRMGDVILDLAGRPVAGTGSLQALVASLGAGARVPLTIWRDGRPRVLQIRITRIAGQTLAGR